MSQDQEKWVLDPSASRFILSSISDFPNWACTKIQILDLHLSYHLIYCNIHHVTLTNVCMHNVVCSQMKVNQLYCGNSVLYIFEGGNCNDSFEWLKCLHSYITLFLKRDKFNNTKHLPLIGNTSHLGTL
jgi:hypothetical protein